MRRPLSLTFLALLVFLTACSTTLHVREVAEESDTPALSGVPFRLPAPYSLHVFERTEKGEYKAIRTFEVELADTEKLYTVNFTSDFLADPAFGLTISEDGLIQKLTLDSTIKADEALAAAAEAADKVTAKIKEEREAAEAREKGRRQELDDAAAARKKDAEAQENARLAAYQAFLAAETAVGQYAELAAGGSATPAELLAKRNEVYSLQAKANTLYRLAGMSPPYELDLPGS